jgi:hypothetical protein
VQRVGEGEERPRDKKEDIPMRFYYISIVSIAMLAVIYLVGTVILFWIGQAWRKHYKRAWLAMTPFFMLLYAAPVAEEFWIAWNFGRLCAKDAGIFVYETVEVEGFYDATRQTLPGPRTQQAAEQLDRGGYRFYEMVFPDFKGGPSKVVHLEKVNGIWASTVLDQPTARYQYKELASHWPASHQVKKFERVVVDQESGEVLGRYLNYYRGAPWFFIGLGRPTIPCIETEDDTRKYGTIAVHSLVFGRGPRGREP